MYVFGIFVCMYVCMCVYIFTVYTCMSIPWCACRGQKTILRKGFSSSILWVLGTELRLSDLEASTLTHGSILLAQIFLLYTVYKDIFSLSLNYVCMCGCVHMIAVA